MLTTFQFIRTFVVPVLVLHPVSSAHKSSLRFLNHKNNTPPMPLNEAHLGGFFILGDE